MNAETFVRSVDGQEPPEGVSDTLRSLWWDRKGDWDRAHGIAQRIPTARGSVVHAYLHREEGVLWNADYWYSQAGRSRPELPLDEEWRRLVEEMLEADGA